MVDTFNIPRPTVPLGQIRDLEQMKAQAAHLRDSINEVVSHVVENIYPQLRKLEEEIDEKAASSHTHALDDLSDVNVGSPGAGDDGKVLTWNNGNSEYDLQAVNATVDIDGATETTDPPDLNNDDLLMYDGSATANRKINILNFRRRTTGTLAATGTTSGGAATVVTELTQVTSADASNVGVILDGWGDGTVLFMENTSARTITIYPHAGGTINGGSSVTLASGVFCLIWQDTNDWRKVDI